MGFVKALLMIQERRGLHQEHGKSSHADIVEAVTSIGAGAWIWQLLEALAQLLNENLNRGFDGRYLYQKRLKSTSTIITTTYDALQEPIQN